MRRLAAVLTASLLAAPLAAEPLRMTGRAFDRRAEIEVRDLDRTAAERAIVDAFRELERARDDLRAIEAMARPGEPVVLDGGQAELVRRTLGICQWSAASVGPLGGEIFRLWGLRRPATAFPVPAEIERAVASARCERAVLDATTGALALAPGSALDFFPFELGWAVDRAAGRLVAAGAGNFWIELGGVVRAAGGGADGVGWSYQPPWVAGQLEPLPPVPLRDRALALLRPGDRPLRIAGESFSPYLDLRRGRPGGAPIAAVFVVADLAIDAQAIGYAMAALGPRDGTMLLGSLSPRPSIRWLLGGGDGAPVLTDVNWGVLLRP